MFEYLSEIDWLWREPMPTIAICVGVVCYLFVQTGAVVAFAKSLRRQ